MNKPEPFEPFRIALPVRVTDINYGGHLGNDALVALLHEARARWLASLGHSEADVGGGTGLIMTRLEVDFRAEVFAHQTLGFTLEAEEVGRAGFRQRIRIEREEDGVLVAEASTRFAAFDYARRRIARLPAEFAALLGGAGPPPAA